MEFCEHRFGRLLRQPHSILLGVLARAIGSTMSHYRRRTMSHYLRSTMSHYLPEEGLPAIGSHFLAHCDRAVEAAPKGCCSTKWLNTKPNAFAPELPRRDVVQSNG